jgi:tetratricopeptide (TPR) repeat protein
MNFQTELKLQAYWRLQAGRRGLTTAVLSIGLAGVCPGAVAQLPSIQGKVVDSAHLPVAGAEIHLEREHVAVHDTASAADGSFAFEGLAAGTYSVVAKKAEVGESVVAAVVLDGKASQPITLVLTSQRATTAGTTPQSMEFADNPNFTIAGVTDWTAAGGHGSDVSLRTSEALNRETLTLKPAQAGAPEAAGHEREVRLRKALEAAPQNFAANRELGKLYLSEGRYHEAVPLLQKAYDLNPSDAVAEADLAVALQETGDLAQARRHVEHAASHADNADVHRAAGAIYEASDDPLRAVREFALAVREDPSELNYFVWGEELLQHRAVLQAREVFEQGVKRYPRSSRLLTSLGATLFASALYKEAAERLCEASDLDPNDPEPYRFMGKIKVVAPSFDSCMEMRLARYAEVYPDDALANYFYAMDLWKQQGATLDAATEQKVEALLTKAVTIDPKCSEGFLQLGNLRASQRKYAEAIGWYVKAIATDPQSSEAHYRLGVAYDRTGERAKAAVEFAAHDAINKQQAADTERQRKEIKQFVVEADKAPSAP